MIKILLIISFAIFSFAETFTVSNTVELRDALLKASINKESDTIILNKGVYKTSSDEKGTFIYKDNQEFDLIIKSADGLSSYDVILDGNKKDQILNFMNSKKSTLFLKNITIKNGNLSTVGGTIFSNQNIVLDSCNLYRNDLQRYLVYSFREIKMNNISMY